MQANYCYKKTENFEVKNIFKRFKLRMAMVRHQVQDMPEMGEVKCQLTPRIYTKVAVTFLPAFGNHF